MVTLCMRMASARRRLPEPLETWEDWEEIDFLAEEGTVERGGTLPASVLSEAQEVLDDAEDGSHLHLHESEDD